MRETVEIFQAVAEQWEDLDSARAAILANGLNGHICQVGEWSVDDADGLVNYLFRHCSL
jgi:hypothetical protein